MSLGLHRRLPQGASVYLFVIDLVKITGVPFASRSSHCEKLAKRKLKVTVLHGSKQKEIGEFDITLDKCTINKRISCRLFAATVDDLGKLHVYIDQACSSGLTGHIAIDLKEFVHEQNQELWLEYPLSARDLDGVPKLKMSAQCNCLREPEYVLDRDSETIEIIEQRGPELFLENVQGASLSPAEANISSGHAECTAVVLAEHPNKVTRQRVDGQHDSTGETLQKLEGILLDLDSRLKSLLSTYRVSYSDVADREKGILEIQNQSKFGWAVEEFSECFVCSDRFSDMFEGLTSSLSSCDSCSSASDLSTCCDETDLQRLELEPVIKSPISRSRHSRMFTKTNILKLILIAGLSALGAKSFRQREKYFCRLNLSNHNNA
ncbi:hypothetical protein O6H91_21G072000 [Diphasiastrum complanatum]|uniref:Uncharacterized protein n=1 Tax=Diphasiastrum complanatum TaxID=34168 RepID=A0ACC2AM01_DIPCM|nr:hypothetical protein O6H91_21G072000 [Diphasiastrum complanatum]